MMNNKFHIGWCPFCNQGWIDIVKDSSQNRMLLLCDECFTTWDNPTDIQLNNPMKYELLNKLETPSLNEIQEMGWDKLIISIDKMP
jgi:hypothetical protein